MAFDTVSRETPPATPPKLAQYTGRSLSSVQSLLKRMAWWGSDERQAARAEHYRRLRALAEERGYPGVQGMRAHHALHYRRLTLPQVQEIRRRLALDESPTHIARGLGIHMNTVFSLRRGRTLRIETQGAEDSSVETDQQVTIVTGEASTAQLTLSRRLYQALGAPPFLQLSRQGRRHALVLEPGSAEQGFPVEQGPPLAHISVERQLFQTLGLPAGAYAAVRVPHQAKVHLSDYPSDQAASMIPLSEACEQLQISRQRLSQVIAAGKLHAFYDSERKQLVVLSSAILDRLDQTTTIGSDERCASQPRTPDRRLPSKLPHNMG